MRILSPIRRIILGWFVLSVVQMIAGALMYRNVSPVPGVLPWLLATNLLVVIVLYLAAMRSRWRFLPLTMALFAIPFAIVLVNLAEGVFFLGNAGIAWRTELANSALVYLVSAPVWAILFLTPGAHSIEAQPLAPASARGWVWRLSVSDVAYLFLYFTAGMFAFPFIREFYSTQTVPSFGTIIPLQLALRGPVFIGICLLLIRMLRLERGPGALAVGLAFTALSGVAPLLIPNPYLPDPVRWVHFVEVGASNFLFGAFIGWLWNKGTPPARVVAQQAA